MKKKKLLKKQMIQCHYFNNNEMPNEPENDDKNEQIK